MHTSRKALFFLLVSLDPFFSHLKWFGTVSSHCVYRTTKIKIFKNIFKEISSIIAVSLGYKPLTNKHEDSAFEIFVALVVTGAPGCSRYVVF